MKKSTWKKKYRATYDTMMLYMHKNSDLINKTDTLVKEANFKVNALREVLSKTSEALHAKNGIIKSLDIKHHDLEEQIKYKTKIIQDYNKEREQYENNLKANDWTIKDLEKKFKTLLNSTRVIGDDLPSMDEVRQYLIDHNDEKNNVEPLVHFIRGNTAEQYNRRINPLIELHNKYNDLLARNRELVSENHQLWEKVKEYYRSH